MSRERRIRGRHIRKRRRLMARLGQAMHELSIALKRFARALATAVEPFFILFASTRRQNAFYWRRITTANTPARVPMGRPSQTGGEALRSPHSAFEDDDPFEGIGDF